MTITLTALQQQRRDTASNWTSNNTVLLAGEWGIETDTKKFKIGDGTTAWQSLDYIPIPDVNRLLTGNLTVGGDLTVNGTTTTISTQNLLVEDKNIEIGKVSTPTDTTADGGGITLKGATDKTFNWLDATDSWTSSENIALGDSKKLQFGDSQDLQIFHDSANSYIKDNGTGQLRLQTNELLVINPSLNENILKASADGSIELYHDNVKKAQTSSTGFDIPEDFIGGSGSKLTVGASGDLTLFHDSTNSYVQNNTGDLILGDTNHQYFRGNTSDKSVSLYFNGSEKIKTSANGLDLPDNSKLQLGDSQDLKIYHNTNSYIDNSTGITFIRNTGTNGSQIQLLNNNSGIKIQGTTGEQSIICESNGSVELYHDNVKKAETSSTGFDVTGNIAASGTISGTLANGVVATTQSASDNSTKVATTAYVDNQVSAGGGGGGGTGGGGEQIFFESEIQMDNSYTISQNHNALVAGPLTIASGATLTINSPSVVTIP